MSSKQIYFDGDTYDSEGEVNFVKLVLKKGILPASLFKDNVARQIKSWRRYHDKIEVAKGYPESKLRFAKVGIKTKPDFEVYTVDSDKPMYIEIKGYNSHRQDFGGNVHIINIGMYYHCLSAYGEDRYVMVLDTTTLNSLPELQKLGAFVNYDYYEHYKKQKKDIQQETIKTDFNNLKTIIKFYIKNKTISAEKLELLKAINGNYSTVYTNYRKNKSFKIKKEHIGNCINAIRKTITKLDTEYLDTIVEYFKEKGVKL